MGWPKGKDEAPDLSGVLTPWGQIMPSDFGLRLGLRNTMSARAVSPAIHYGPLRVESAQIAPGVSWVTASPPPPHADQIRIQETADTGLLLVVGRLGGKNDFCCFYVLFFKQEIRSQPILEIHLVK